MHVQSNPEYREAYEFAATAHAGDVRKGTSLPYIVHPLAVAESLLAIGVDDPGMIRAALLHDVVEHTPVTVEEIRRRFGDEVAGLVAELTRPPETFESREALSRYLRLLSPKAVIIKLADRIENVRGLQLIADDPQFVERYLNETWEVLLPFARERQPLLASMLQETYEQARRTLASGTQDA